MYILFHVFLLTFFGPIAPIQFLIHFLMSSSSAPLNCFGMPRGALSTVRSKNQVRRRTFHLKTRLICRICIYIVKAILYDTYHLPSEPEKEFCHPIDPVMDRDLTIAKTIITFFLPLIVIFGAYLGKLFIFTYPQSLIHVHLSIFTYPEKETTGVSILDE